jgi:beta-glucosidase/6-phospho-beta-glucosidase/beta-galactosidase
VLTDDARGHDTDLTMFLRAYLMQLQHTIPDGVPVKGYFQRGTMDNCEWTVGFGNRFVFVFVDSAQKHSEAEHCTVPRDPVRNAVV